MSVDAAADTFLGALRDELQEAKKHERLMRAVEAYECFLMEHDHKYMEVHATDQALQEFRMWRRRLYDFATEACR